MQIGEPPSVNRAAAPQSIASRSRPARRTRALAARLLLALSCLLSTAPAWAQAPSAKNSTPAAGEVALERRLLAPCCWNQTLDAHESDLAASLRSEVRARLHAGEPVSAIEDDLVARYGERIRAVDKGHEPGGAMPFLIGPGVLVIGAALIVMARRWRRSAASAHSREDVRAASSNDAQSPDDPYDTRLDDELRALGD
jgi:cytochrome c-type biogenesis protein CcmH